MAGQAPLPIPAQRPRVVSGGMPGAQPTYANQSPRPSFVQVPSGVRLPPGTQVSYPTAAPMIVQGAPRQGSSPAAVYPGVPGRPMVAKVSLGSSGASPAYPGAGALSNGVSPTVDRRSPGGVASPLLDPRGSALSGDGRPSAKPGNTLRSTKARQTVSLGAHASTEGLKTLEKNKSSVRQKTPEVECFLRESLLRDPFFARAQFTNSDLDEIVKMMEYFEFDPDDEDEDDDAGKIKGVGSLSGYCFVVDTGSFEVRYHGVSQATLGRGATFGWDFLNRSPQMSSVFAVVTSGVWGASGEKIQKRLTEKAKDRVTENRKFLDAISMFKGLRPRQLDLLSSALVEQNVTAGTKVVSIGEESTALYFVRSGQLLVDNQKTLGPGETFGERALLHGKPRSATVTAATDVALLRLEAESLKSVVGPDLMTYLERSLVLDALRTSETCRQFSATEQVKIFENMEMLEVPAGGQIEAVSQEGFVLFAIVQGSASDVSLKEDRSPAGQATTCQPGQCMEVKDWSLSRLVRAGSEGAKVAILREVGLETALRGRYRSQSEVSKEGGSDLQSTYARKMVIVKKVPLLRHLNKQQTEKVIGNFKVEQRAHGYVVFKQGEPGQHFFVIVEGEVTVLIDGKKVRTMGKNATFGERALLFDDLRTATIQVSSGKVELWTLEKSVFKQIITEKMLRELEYRISIQDARVTLADLKLVGFLGTGAFSCVRLVENKNNGAKYALKTCKKTSSGKMPDEMKTECDILKENDHPFVMYMVDIFETRTLVSMLTEILFGGELWSALRKLPYMLSRKDARFYAGSLLIGIEALWDRNIVYRDLKPENVMLDTQGYVKIIDFGVSKKLGERESRTYTVVGTPHYMAPEVANGKGYGTEVDLWSLGVMIFEFVCGYLPFGNNLEDARQVCAAVRRCNLKFPSAYKDTVGQDLIKRMLCLPASKRLGNGVHGIQEVCEHPFFAVEGATANSNLFDKLMGRELEPPWTPGAWSPPKDVKTPPGYQKETEELFGAGAICSSGEAPVVRARGFFCHVFGRR
eukprot:TRINITY_DN11685_c0_g1_i1.p1 TRINITY_DN11685_c0_g1~~TRINITY_DN11685_c0_g1_i1.p1  ORF type:complete len:1045 (-),score=191.86 TRINITY_DN11685_c0_g1_i1:13-3114(-)